MNNIFFSKIENQKSLWFFTLLYCLTMIFANWFDPRLIRIPFLNLETDAGTLIFPITFLVSNIITEVYGYKFARRAIWCGFLFNLFGLAFGFIITQLPSPHFADNAAYDSVFHKSARVVIASSISYILAEPLNSFIMSKMKIKFKDFIALRFISSTVFASLFDSTVFTFIAFYGYIELKYMLKFIITMWGIKVFIEIFGTPISIRAVKWLKKYEQMDVFDRNTKFNIFSLNTTYYKADNEYNSIDKDINYNKEFGEYYIKTDLSSEDIRSAWKLIKDCEWCKNIPYEVFHKANNFSLCFGIYNKKDENIYGFGRVISDYLTYAYICDIVIHPNYRNKEAKNIYLQNGLKVAKDHEFILEKEDLFKYEANL